MRCSKVINSLNLLIDKEGDEEKRAALEKHLAKCSSCSVLFNTEMAARKIIQDTPKAEMTENEKAKILNTVILEAGKEKNLNANSYFHKRRFAFAGYAFIAIFALASIGLAIGTLSRTTNDSGTVAIENGFEESKEEVRINLADEVAESRKPSSDNMTGAIKAPQFDVKIIANEMSRVASSDSLLKSQDEMIAIVADSLIRLGKNGEAAYSLIEESAKGLSNGEQAFPICALSTDEGEDIFAIVLATFPKDEPALSEPHEEELETKDENADQLNDSMEKGKGSLDNIYVDHEMSIYKEILSIAKKYQLELIDPFFNDIIHLPASINTTKGAHIYIVLIDLEREVLLP